MGTRPCLDSSPPTGGGRGSDTRQGAQSARPPWTIRLTASQGAQEVIVGQEHAQNVIRECLDGALSGHGGTVLVLGEPGIGKTTLLRDAAKSHRRSAIIYEWFREGEPFSPWSAVIRKVRDLLPIDEHSDINDLLHRLAQGSAPLSSNHSQHPERPADDDLFVALTNALLLASKRRPLLLLLDDVGTASPASLNFVRHLALELWDSPLCLVLALQDTGADSDESLARALDDLARTARTVTLTGLGLDDCEKLIVSHVGRQVPDSVVQLLHARSGGNPLFLDQAARLWQSSGSLSIVPRQIEDILLQRLRLLPPATRTVLETASVLGREFSTELLYRIGDITRKDLKAHLSVLQHARLLQTTGAATMTFVHSAIIELLYTSLPPEAAAQFHARTVTKSGDEANELGLTPTALATHAEGAGDKLDPASTYALHTAAGRYCVNQMATERALDHYRKAHDCLPTSAKRDRSNALLNLATHLGWRGLVDEAEVRFRAASDIAQELDDSELIGNIALAMHNLAQHQKTIDDEAALPYLQEAYAKLHATPSSDLHNVNTVAEAVTEALADRADSRDDNTALTAALWAQYDAAMEPRAATRRAAALNRLSTVARTTGDTMLANRVAAMRWPTAIEVDDSGALLRFMRRPDARGVLPLPDQIALDFFFGYKDSAQALLNPTLQRHRERPNATLDDEALMLAHLGWVNALAENDLDEADAIISFMASAHPYTWIHQALTDIRRGDVHLAEMILHRVSGVPTALKPLVYRVLAEAAATTGSVALHDAVMEHLRPLEGKWLISAFGTDISGPVDLWLGRLFRLQGKSEEARVYLTRAEASATSMTSLPWQLECRLELALLNHDHARIDDSAIKAERLGLRALAAWARHPSAPTQSHRLAFRSIEGGWLLEYDTHNATLPARKGLQDIHVLLTHAGKDVSAYDLLIGPGAVGREAAPAYSGEAMIDSQARQEIRAEIERLEEQIEAALHTGSPDKAQQLDKERDELLAYIGTATGLFNSVRALGDETEKARKTVSSRIRHAIGLIEADLPDFADHLTKQIVLGVRCRYTPTDADVLDLT